MRIKVNSRKALALCTILYSATAMAQQKADTADHLKGDHEIKEVVVTGQYAANSIENAVQRIRVTDRKKIDAMNAQTLRDVLTNDLNIRIGQDNAISASSITMQGISGQNVKILIDGVPVIGRQDGNIDLNQVSLSNIERIEIVEGPMSVNYGTDALAGTINLITKKTQRNEIEAGVMGFYESIGNYNGSARVGLHKGRHTVGISGGRNFFDGWTSGEKIEPDFSAKIADSTRVQSWKPKEQYFGDLNYSYKTKNTTLNYKGSFFHEKITILGMPRLPYYENAFDAYFRTRRIDNAVFATSALSGNRNINFMAAYNDYARVKTTYYNDLTTLDKTLSLNPEDLDTSEFHTFASRASYSTNKTDVKVNYEVGYDLNVSDGTGKRIKNYKQTIGDYAAFASMEYSPVQKFTIRPGLRYGYNTSYNAPVIPSLNFRYKVDDNVTLRASYARGFRSPSLKDLYFDFVDINHNIKGNPGLQAENSNNYIMSAVYTQHIDNTTYKIEGNGYYNYITNLIDLRQTVPGTTEFIYVNVDKAITKGIQVNGEVTIGQLKISAGALYMGRYNQISEDTNALKFTYTPELRGSINYDWKKAGLTAAFFYKYTGVMPSYTADGQRSFVSDYTMADISLTKTLFAKRLTIAIGSKNLFDVKNIGSTLGATGGGAHSGSSTSVALNCGRTYFIRTELNLKKK